MKRIIMAISCVVVLAATPAFAQPFTGTMGSDTYGIAQGGGNIPGVATPRDNNDNLAGSPNPAQRCNQPFTGNILHT